MKECTGCQSQLGMNVKTIEKVPFRYPGYAGRNANQVDEVVSRLVKDLEDEYYIKDRTQEMAVLLVLNHENDYHNFKKSFNKLAVLTQCMKKQGLKRFNLSVASNVMK